MATKEELRAIVVRALDDPAFAAKLREDPVATLLEEGVTRSEEEHAALQKALADAEVTKRRDSKLF